MMNGIIDVIVLAWNGYFIFLLYQYKCKTNMEMVHGQVFNVLIGVTYRLFWLRGQSVYDWKTPR